jgi:hypothetical protein
MQMITRSRPRRAILALAGLALLAACADGPAAPAAPEPPPSPVGNYTLATFDGNPVPYTMYADGSYLLQVSGGTLAVLADGRFVARGDLRETVLANVSTYRDSTRGTWVQGPDGTVVLTDEDGATSTATHSRTALEAVFAFEGARVRLGFRR